MTDAVTAYRLNSYIVAIEYTSNGTLYVPIEPGAVLKVPPTSNPRWDRVFGTVEALYQGRRVSVFQDDLTEYAVRVKDGLDF